MTGNIAIKRIYAQADPEDGKRILVDRLWPRGISHERAALHSWMVDVSPSMVLQRWYGRQGMYFGEFAALYEEELRVDSAKAHCVEELLYIVAQEKVTLLYATRSEIMNHAAVLQSYLEGMIKKDAAVLASIPQFA